MLKGKTQDYFLKNLIGCFYKNYLILKAKTLNENFVLEVIDLSCSTKNFLKGPKISNIKISMQDLPDGFSDTNRFKDILHDIKKLYIEHGEDYGLIDADTRVNAYKSQDFKNLNFDPILKISSVETLIFYIKFLPMVQHLKFDDSSQISSSNIHPFRYALNLDKFICDFSGNLSEIYAKEKIAELLSNNWRAWNSLNNFSTKNTYDVVLVNSTHMAIVKVNEFDVSVDITDLNDTEGLVSAAVCDLIVLKSLLKHRFEEVGCEIGTFTKLEVEYNPEKQSTFLTSSCIKSIPYLRNKSVQKYLNKTLTFSDNLTIEAIESPIDEQRSTNLLFSKSFGLPYIKHYENCIKYSFNEVLSALAKKGITIQQLRIVNILRQNLIEHELHQIYVDAYSDQNINQKLESILHNIIKETNCYDSALNENILLAIHNFEMEHEITPKLVIQNKTDIYLIYEPSNPDNRLVRYEWFSKAKYSESQGFEWSKADIHKSSIKDILRDLQILHVYDSDFLVWSYPIIFTTPLEKQKAFENCLSEDMVKIEASNLVERCNTPGYLVNLISSLHDSTSTNHEDSVYGFFFPAHLQISDSGYTYEGIFLEVDKSNKIDLTHQSIKTLNGKDLPKNYLTFKRLIRL